MNNHLLTSDQVKLLIDKLGGIEEVKKIISKEHDLWSNIKIWKVLNIGNCLNNAVDFYNAINDNGFRISNRARDLMKTAGFISSISQNNVKLGICIATTKELLGRAGTSKEIYAEILKNGGELLPAEAGPQIRLQYTCQPANEWLCIAMNHIIDLDGHLTIFGVGRGDDDLWLGTNYDNNDFIWDESRRWVFVHPNQHRLG